MQYGWQACALWSFLLRAKVEPLHQNDYTTATAAARNGRNETPFNEDTNLRNATLLSVTDAPHFLRSFPVVFHPGFVKPATEMRLSVKRSFSLYRPCYFVQNQAHRLYSIACVAVVHNAPQRNN